MGGPLTEPNYWSALVLLWEVIAVAIPVCIVLAVVKAWRGRHGDKR